MDTNRSLRPSVSALLCVAAFACSSDEDVSGARELVDGTDARASRPKADAGNIDFGNADDDAAVRVLEVDAAALDATSCAEGRAIANPVTPTIWLVIDASSSMNAPFSGITRWTALRGALMNEGGVVETLQAGVRFGMVIYNGNNDADGVELACANLVAVDPKRNNWTALDDAYPAQEIGGWTPTDRALEHVVAKLPDADDAKAETSDEQVYVVLATDGAPNDMCRGASGGSGDAGSRNPSAFDPVAAQRVVDEVMQGVADGMKMFVISLAGYEPELAAHLDELALIGATDSPVFEPTTQGQLVETLREVIGQTTCSVELNGTVSVARACTGTVTLNGVALECNEPDGWMMLDERTVRLQGEACDTFLSSASEVTADFPCAVFVPD